MSNTLTAIGAAFIAFSLLLAWLAGGVRLVDWAMRRWGHHYHVFAIAWSIYCFVPGILLVIVGAFV